jgi:hypothetical protein
VTYYGRRRGPRWGMIVAFVVLGTAGLALVSALTPVRTLLPMSAAVPLRAVAPTPTVEPTPIPPAETAESHLARGDAELAQGHWPAAVQAYQDALRLNSLLTPAASRLARAQLYQNRLAEGLNAAQRAVDIQPTSAEAQTVLALALDWNNNSERTLVVARRALGARSEEPRGAGRSG